MPNLILRRLALAALALIAAPLSAQADDAFLPETAPTDLGAAEVGVLTFRGGVEIFPDKAEIGGISSLEWHDGTLFAVTDDGRWVELTPEDVGERLVDVSQVRLGPLTDPKGAKLSAKERGDAEAVTRLASGEWLVAFEREHRIWRYADLARPATGTETRAAGLVAGAAPNAGIETLAAWPGGLLACGEWVDPARSNCLRITDAGAAPLALAAPEGIAEFGGVPTDAACAKDGTCFVLLRSLTPADNQNRAAVVQIDPDGTPRTLAVLAPPLTLDNFEGLALREEQGRRFLYLASDDNFSNCQSAARSGCQRTLLMKFEIAPPRDGPVPPPPGPEELAALPTARPAVRPFPGAAHVDVVLQTELGPVTIALETERAPVTAGNFLRYVDEKRLDGTTFYRAMDLDGERKPSGLVQGGTRGDPKRVRPKIAFESTAATGLTHAHGALSMAMAAPGDADGDFFIMVEDQKGFDADPAATDPAWQAGYAAFGYVTGGMEIIAQVLAAPRDPEAGEGVMKGQMLKPEIRIISARRVVP
ncbi:esterase-like activity of phytase family protein [Erythrobacter sp.]|uniref:esterase-like activity of phytase family protein n=1 Tax=Erythrobacter sp. TaxID=1042 RepID=UPI0025E9F3FD|nr:esterase-like activity of phytase family protein [Erythrobacter sp.]